MDIHSPLKRILATLILLLGVTAFGSATAAALYKWTDEEGNVHYSQSPPEGNKAERMITKDAPPAPAQQDDATDNTGEGDAEQTDENAIPPEAGQDPEIAEKRRQNCEIARKNMETYKQYRKIQQPDGSVVVMSDDMRNAKMEEAQKMIDEYCQ